MLTVIYVYEPATLTIETRDPRDEHATIRRYDGRTPAREIRALREGPSMAFEPGVYAVLSRKALQIDWTQGRVETATLDQGRLAGSAVAPGGRFGGAAPDVLREPREGRRRGRRPAVAA